MHRNKRGGDTTRKGGNKGCVGGLKRGVVIPQKGAIQGCMEG